MKKLKYALTLMLAITAIMAIARPSPVLATAIGVNGTVQNRVVSIDGNGRELQLPDVGYKVFEVHRTATGAQVTDERGKTPTNGLLHMVCVESGTAGTAPYEYALVFDELTSAAIGYPTGATSGRKLLPPVQRATSTERCVTVDAQFTSGLFVLNSSAVGATYVYWRPIGGKD